MKYIPFVILVFILSACNESKSYHLLYPIEASKQELSRIQGYRFLSSTLDSPASILVLSNPIENGSFVDFAFALSNNHKNSVHISEKDFSIKISKHGDLELVSLPNYAQSKPYKKPEGFDTLTPKMQAFGCSTTNMTDNIEISSFNASQSWVWDKHLQYPFVRPELYLKKLEILAGETKGAIFRIALPEMPKDFEQATLLVKLKIEEDAYRFKFILQSLQ